jgi:secreted PhoX family phosphatase
MLSTGPVALEGVVGTFENCGGGVTPWGTVLTCEENVRYMVPEGPGTRGGVVQGSREKLRHPEFSAPAEHFGWVVELDPRDPSWVPRKHTALGRFRHENVSVDAREGQPLRLYMGDDRQAGGLWRFTSSRPWSRSLGRDAASALLHEGTLAIADLDGGRWIEVGAQTPVAAPPPDKVPPEYLEAHRSARTLGELYPRAWQVDAWVAGAVAGGSALGRPEGTVLLDGWLHVSLTEPREDRPSGVLRLRDEGERLRWEWVLLAGEELVGPDNLAADGDALLIATDGDDAVQANALYRLRRGRLERLLVAPPDAEITGPSVAPDRSVIFACIQHPAATWGDSQLVALPLR